MSQLSTRRQMELFQTLRDAAAERHKEEARIAKTRSVGTKETRTRRDKRRRDVEEAHRVERESVDGEAEGRRSMLVASYEATRDRTQAEYKERRTKAESQAAKITKQAEQEKKEQGWEILTLFDAASKKPPEKLKAYRKRLKALRSELEAIATEAVTIARDRGLAAADYALAPIPEPGEDPTADDAACDAAAQNAREAADRAKGATQSLYDQTLPRLLGNAIPAGAFIGMLSAALPIAGMTLGWDDWRAYAIGVGAAAVTSIAAFFALRSKARRQTRGGFAQAETSLREAESSDPRRERRRGRPREQRAGRAARPA